MSHKTSQISNGQSLIWLVKNKEAYRLTNYYEQKFYKAACRKINNWFMLSVRIELWMRAGSLESTRES